MIVTRLAAVLLASVALLGAPESRAGQAPGAAAGPDVPVSHRDRVYAAEQFSNTVSVTDPADNSLLGVIRLGDPQPGNLSPLYRGQVLGPNRIGKLLIPTQHWGNHFAKHRDTLKPMPVAIVHGWHECCRSAPAVRSPKTSMNTR